MGHRSTLELERALDHIAAAPADDGALEMIVRRPAVGVREQLDVAVIDQAVGLEGDTWAIRPTSSTADGRPHPDKQITLMSARVIDALTAGDRARWPLAGDQLYVDLDVTPDNLPPGTRLTIGSAVLEITAAPHRGCAKFADRFGVNGIRFVNTGVGAARRFRGVNARVVTGGRVGLGDAVTKVPAVVDGQPARIHDARGRERPDV